MYRWIVAAAALLLLLVLPQFHGFDLRVSDAVYDFNSGHWPLDHGTSALRPFFYEGPKYAVIVIGMFLMTSSIRPRLLNWLSISRSEAVFLFICLACVPAATALLKHTSGVSCPRAIQHYGGEIIDDLSRVSIESFRDSARPSNCWPSGHASGGFALLAFAFLPRRRRICLLLAIPGLSAGSLMGAYQILHGAHFLSHVVATFCIALVIIPFVALSIRKIHSDFYFRKMLKDRLHANRHRTVI